MKFFVLLYINSPVFEKQIKSAKINVCVRLTLGR